MNTKVVFFRSTLEMVFRWQNCKPRWKRWQTQELKEEKRFLQSRHNRYTYPEKAYNILAHNNNIPAHNKTLLRDCLFITFDSTDNSHVKCLVCLFVILSTVKFACLKPFGFVFCLGSACLYLLLQRSYSVTVNMFNALFICC